ncbi:hypothetical protein Hanom_Chr10g00962321 [Helianthus anomalus]
MILHHHHHRRCSIHLTIFLTSQLWRKTHVFDLCTTNLVRISDSSYDSACLWIGSKSLILN